MKKSFFISFIFSLLCVACSYQKKIARHAIPYNEDLAGQFNNQKADLKKYQFFLGPSGFYFEQEVDSFWSHPGKNGRMVLLHKQGTNRIFAKPFTPVTFVRAYVLDETAYFVMNMGPIVKKRREIFPKSTLIFRSDTSSEEGPLILFTPKTRYDSATQTSQGYMEFGSGKNKRVYDLTFPSDTTALYVYPQKTSKSPDRYRFKGSKVGKW